MTSRDMTSRDTEHLHHLLTSDEVASLLKVTRGHVSWLARHGKIPAMKWGRGWRFSEEAIRDWLERYSNQPTRREETHHDQTTF